MANKDDIQLNIGVSEQAIRNMQKKVKGVYSSFGKLAEEYENKKAKGSAAELAAIQKLVNKQKEMFSGLNKGIDAEKEKLKLYKQQEKALEKQVSLGKRLSQGAVAGAGRAANVGLGVARNAGRLGMSAAGSVGGFLVGAMQAGYAKYSEHQQALGGTIGLASTSRLRNAAYGSGGTRYGYNKTDVAGMIPAMGRATGNVSPIEMMQANRASGMDLGEVAGRFGALRQSGHSFNKTGKGPSAGAKEFEKLMAGGVASGIEKSRLHEYFDSVEKIAGTAGGMSVGNVSHSNIGKTLSMWGASGHSGMQGARGGALMSKVLGGIMSPGGGEAGEALMNQAFGFGKPGGTASYYEAMKARQGIHSNPEGISKVMGEIKSQYGVGQEGAMATSNALGVSLEQAELLQKIYDSDKTAIEKQEAIEEVMEEAKSIQQQSLEQMQGMGGHLKRLAGIHDRGITFGGKSAEWIEMIQDKSIEAAEWLQAKIFPILQKIAEYIKHGVIPGLKDIFDWSVSSSHTEDAETKFLNLKKILNNGVGQGQNTTEYITKARGLAYNSGSKADFAALDELDSQIKMYSDPWNPMSNSAFAETLKEQRKNMVAIGSKTSQVTKNAVLANRMQTSGLVDGDRGQGNVLSSVLNMDDDQRREAVRVFDRIYKASNDDARVSVRDTKTGELLSIDAGRLIAQEIGKLVLSSTEGKTTKWVLELPKGVKAKKIGSGGSGRSSDTVKEDD